MAFTRIWKFALKMTDDQYVIMPVENAFLHLGVDSGNDICMWMAVNPLASKAQLQVIIVGTGSPLPRVGDFLGTVMTGRYVWHVFTGPNHSILRLKGFHYETKGNPG